MCKKVKSAWQFDGSKNPVVKNMKNLNTSESKEGMHYLSQNTGKQAKVGFAYMFQPLFLGVCELVNLGWPQIMKDLHCSGYGFSLIWLQSTIKPERRQIFHYGLTWGHWRVNFCIRLYHSATFLQICYSVEREALLTTELIYSWLTTWCC